MSELKLALKTIIFNHYQLSYSKELPDAYTSVYYMDAYPSYVYDMFSTDTIEFSSTKWNKEHVIPKSWWGGAQNKAYSDIFSVIPSEKNANTQKSNYSIGKVANAIFDNGRIRVGTPVSGQGGANNRVFEPTDSLKGDFARIYFYVSTCYSDLAWGSNPNVQSELVQEDWPTLRPWLSHLLLAWHNADPVSAKEIQINNDAEKVQGNRNPFIDYPVLADHIWGNYIEIPFSLSTSHLYHHIEKEELDPGMPIDTTGIITPVDSTNIIIGDILFADSFDSASEGNSYETGSSSQPWSGDEWFPNSTNVFQAGNALRLGTNKKTGNITSINLNYQGGSLIVDLKVKGWTSIEGDLIVRIGDEEKVVSYTSTIASPFQSVQLLFSKVPPRPTISISTSSKRCFIDDVVVRDASYASLSVVEDVTSDGIVDTQDVLQIYNVINKNISDSKADVNNDGVIDTQDVLAIYDYIIHH